MLENIKYKKALDNKDKYDEQITAIEECFDDDTCTDAASDELQTALVEELETESELTQEDIDQAAADGMAILTMPEGCVSEDDCAWICSNMVGADGIDESELEGEGDLTLTIEEINDEFSEVFDESVDESTETETETETGADTTGEGTTRLL